MISKIKNRTKAFIRRFPPVAHHLRDRQFKTELELIRGTHQNTNTHTSIIHFSVNKAATQHVKSILRRCAVANGMTPASIHDYAFHSNFPYLDHLSAEEMLQYRHIFKRQGYLYSVFGGMIEGIPDLHKYKIVLVIRDPRDILVSSYYSVAYSHTAPERISARYRQFLKNRARVRSLTIDEYVLRESDRVYETFDRYKTRLIDFYPHIHLTRYRDLVQDFEKWLDELLAYCELPVSPELREELIEENMRKQPRTEDIRKHVRKGQPGDYKEKLQPETIELLNRKLKPVLESFGYEL